MLRRSPLKRKKPDPTSAASRAFAAIRAEKEAKKPEKAYAPKLGYCQVSGEYGLLDPHHLYRRSQRPDLVNDPKNIVYITREVHRQATENAAFEKQLQQRFYPDPPKFRAKNDL